MTPANVVAYTPPARTGTDYPSHPDAPNDGTRSLPVPGRPRTGSCADPDALAEALETAGKAAAA